MIALLPALKSYLTSDWTCCWASPKRSVKIHLVHYFILRCFQRPDDWQSLGATCRTKHWVCIHVYVPANMTCFFQTLDLTVNGCAKQRMRKEFVTYYSSAVKEQLDSWKQHEDIEVNFRLSVLKPLHAKWLVELFHSFLPLPGARK